MRAAVRPEGYTFDAMRTIVHQTANDFLSPSSLDNFLNHYKFENSDEATRAIVSQIMQKSADTIETISNYVKVLQDLGKTPIKFVNGQAKQITYKVGEMMIEYAKKNWTLPQ